MAEGAQARQGFLPRGAKNAGTGLPARELLEDTSETLWRILLHLLYKLLAERVVLVSNLFLYGLQKS